MDVITAFPCIAEETFEHVRGMRQCVVNMTAAIEPRRVGKAAGLLLLFGWFLLFCAILSFLNSGWRALQAHLQSKWIETAAHIQKCSLRTYYPFRKNGGGVVYSLRCDLEYEYAGRRYQYDLHTRSERSARSRIDIDNWIGQNPPGTILLARVNPSNPNELVVESDLPQRQFGTVAEALATAAIFGLPAFVMIGVGRRLAGAKRPNV